MTEARPTYDELLALVQQQGRQLEALQAEVVRLRAELDSVRRQGKRQAAPFRKGAPKPDPQRPGRKAGEQHGTHGHRPPPPPDQIDKVLEAPLPAACPDCGGTLTETATTTQYQTEIPRRPLRRQFTIHVGCCDQCRRRVQGRPPLQTSDATGAAASQLGPDAQAAVVALNKERGLPHGKIAQTFDARFGIDLSRALAAPVVASRRTPGRRLTKRLSKRFRTPTNCGWTRRAGGWAAGRRGCTSGSVTARPVIRTSPAAVPTLWKP